MNREQTDARVDRILTDLRERRDARIDKCLEMRAEIQRKLAWKRARGESWWLGDATRFRSGVCAEIPLFHVVVDPASMN